MRLFDLWQQINWFSIFSVKKIFQFFNLSIDIDCSDGFYECMFMKSIYERMAESPWRIFVFSIHHSIVFSHFE